MPIDESELDTHFIVIDAVTTVDSLRRHLSESSGEARYAIVAFSDGRFGVPLLNELTRIAELLGPSVFDTALEDLLPPGVRGEAVDELEVSLASAKRERDRRQNRRLVVLRAGRPVGVLTNESRGVGATGAPLDLFGPYARAAPRDELHRQLDERVSDTICRFCARTFKFYELRKVDESRNDVWAYACPHCNAILRPWSVN